MTWTVPPAHIAVPVRPRAAGAIRTAAPISRGYTLATFRVPPARAVLGLVSRRLAGTRVGFLAAARTGEAGFFESSGLPELRLEALGREASSALVDAEFPSLAARVRHRVLTESEGNPLALLELPASLSLPERAAEQVLPDVLPLGRKLPSTFAARLVQLPGSARALLLLAALDVSGDLRVLQQASAAQDGLDVLAPAERAHLVRIDDSAGRLTFRHPLVRTAVVAASTSAERRHAHHALAQQLASQPERRAWHLAASCVQPDEAVAALLEDTAASVLRRGDAVGAVAALIRAADLHPSGDRRSRLLAQAAFVGAGVTGDLRNVPKFQRLGARPWVARAANELRASGRTRQQNDYVPAGVLTPQEREIALMAASGMSNRQIGARLFLSHRTVGTHLYRVFPKLGITTRAALRDALTEASPDDTT